MSLYIEQEDTRTKLQEKIAADLREKAIRSSMTGGDAPKIDEIEDSKYLEDTKVTTSLASVWLFLFIAIAISIIFFMVFL